MGLKVLELGSEKFRCVPIQILLPGRGSIKIKATDKKVQCFPMQFPLLWFLSRQIAETKQMICKGTKIIDSIILVLLWPTL